MPLRFCLTLYSHMYLQAHPDRWMDEQMGGQVEGWVCGWICSCLSSVSPSVHLSAPSIRQLHLSASFVHQSVAPFSHVFIGSICLMSSGCTLSVYHL